MQTMLEIKEKWACSPAWCLNLRYMTPKLQSIENGVKVDNIVIALELHELMFHYFNEVETLKRTILVKLCFIF